MDGRRRLVRGVGIRDAPSPVIRTSRESLTPVRWAERKYFNRQLAVLMGAGYDIEPYIYNSTRLKEDLRAGIVYKNKKMKYWIDDDENDCFELYARALQIELDNVSADWSWSTDPENGSNVDVARLTRGQLRVKGSFSTSKLSPETTYQVSFLVKLAPDSNLRGQLVSLRLTFPRFPKQPCTLKLPDEVNELNPWIELVVGSFKMTRRTLGTMEFTLERLEEESRGLVIKGVRIKTITSRC